MAGKTLTSSLIVRLIDQVTGPAKKVSSALLGLQAGAKGGMGARLSDAIERNNTALDRTRGHLFDAAAAFYVLKRAITSPVQAAMEFESAMADVRKVVDFESEDAFRSFRDGLVALSREVPTSVNGLAQIAAAAGQAGIVGDELNSFTEAAAKIGVAFDISADEAGDAMAKLRTALGLSNGEVVLLADAMNTLSNAQASSAAQLLDYTRRVGGVATQYGFTAEQAVAFGSAMVSAGAESDVAATSFRNMGAALTAGESATKRQRDALKALGLDAKEVAKAMQDDAVATTVDVMERINALPKDRQGAITRMLFGSEARAVPGMVANMTALRDAIGLVADEATYAGSSFKEFDVRVGVFEGRLGKFLNRFEALKIAVGNALLPALASLMDALGPVVDRLAQFAEAHPELIANATLAASALIGLRVATAALTFAGLLGRGGALALVAAGFNSIAWAATAAKSAIGLQSALAVASGANYSGLAKLVDGLKGIALAVPGVNLLGSGLAAVGAAIGAISAPVLAAIGLAAAAVGAAGFFIWKYWDRLTSVFGGIAKRIGEELAPALNAARPLFDWLGGIGNLIGEGFAAAGKAIGDFWSWLTGNLAQEVLNDDQKAQMAEAGYQWADAMIQSVKTAIAGLIEWFGTLPQRILDAIGKIDLGSAFNWGSGPPAAAYAGAGADHGSLKFYEPGSGPISGQRAAGGRAWKGSTYRVNELGQEFFTPGMSGTIHPAESGVGSGATHITVGDIIIQGAGDARAVANEVKRMLDSELRFAIRGIHSDGHWDR